MAEESFAARAIALSPEQYASFRQAVETGKWPDGKPVESTQRELMLQAIILYETKNIPAENRSGYVPDRCADATAADKESATVADKIIASSRSRQH
ncbi:MAG: DUF1315 family protein [Pseudomonadales bacterium]